MYKDEPMNLQMKSFLSYLFLPVLVLLLSCGGKDKPDPAPEVAKLTSLSLNLDGPKAKLKAVAAHQEAGGITTHNGTGITLSANTQYAGALTLEETTGTTKATATSSYTIAYQITGIDATISATGETPTLTTRNAATGGSLKVTVTKNNISHTVTFPLTVTN